MRILLAVIRSFRHCSLFVLAAIPATIGLAQAGAEVSGQLVDPSGAVLAGVPVRLLGPESVREEQSSELGRFTFRDVPAGPYALILMLPGFSPKVIQMKLDAGQQRALGDILLDVSAFDFAWNTPTMKFLSVTSTRGNLVVNVIRDGDRAISGARVVLMCPVKSTCGATSTDAQGTVRFDGLQAARYRLVISARGFYTREIEFDVFGGTEFEYRGLYLERCQEPTCNPSKRLQGVML